MTDAFKECLSTLDVETARRAWAETFPAYPPLGEKAISVLHYARTLSESMPVKKRAYSHWWLLDHGLPSGLPDRLKPRADRLYPRVVKSVGVSTKTRTALARAVQGEMEYAVHETYADGHRDQPHIVKARMMERRDWVLRA